MEELHRKLDDASGELERLRDEKDQEIMILQAGLDTSIQQLSEAKQVWSLDPQVVSAKMPNLFCSLRIYWTTQLMPKSIRSSLIIARN